MADKEGATGAVGLRRYRTQVRGESRVDFAAYLQRVADDLGLPVSCDARTVARWEDGDVRWPHKPYRRLLEVATGWELAALGLAPRGRKDHASAGPRGEIDTVETVQGSDGDWLDVHRRTLLAGALAGLAALGGAKAPDAEREARLSDLRANPYLLDAETVEDMREIALRYRRSYRSLPPGRLMPQAFGHLQLALDLRPADQPPSLRRGLIATVAEMAALIGTTWSLDLREFAAGEQYLRLAVRAAREAGDVETEAFVLGAKAFHAAYSGDLRAGLHYVAGARRLTARGDSGTNRGWLAAVASELHASAGQERQCQRLLEEASQHLAEPDARPWVGVGAFDAAKLRAYRGGDMRRLGRYREAERALTEALDELAPSMLKHRCTALIDLAETHALARDADRAAARAMEALGLAARTGHRGSIGRIRDVHRRLRGYAADGRLVRQLGERLR